MKKIKKAIGRMLPKKIKSALQIILKFIKSSRSTRIPAEELEIFKLLKSGISTVFDIGAREDLSFYRIKNNCSYHLFEPNKKALTLLKKQIALLHDHKIKLNEFGLSDKNEDDCVYCENSQSFIVNPYLKGVDKGHKSSLRTLDGYATENNVQYIDFLKIDTEGMDYKIIRGYRHDFK